jgi:hypothetical protein
MDFVVLVVIKIMTQNVISPTPYLTSIAKTCYLEAIPKTVIGDTSEDNRE